MSAERTAAMNLEAGVQLDFAGGEFDIDGQCLKFAQRVHSGLHDTGVAIWDGSLILAKYCEIELGSEVFRGARVHELGAGCGVTSVAAAVLGANVVATDLPYCLPLLRDNIDTNAGATAGRGSVQCHALDWLETETGDGNSSNNAGIQHCLTADIVLGADLVWDPSLIPPMLSALRSLLKPSVRTQNDGKEQYVDSSGCCCCCCKLDGVQEEANTFLSNLAADMGIGDFVPANSTQSGIQCSESAWALGQRQQLAPFALLAYTYRAEATHEALMDGLRGMDGNGGFCWSEVPIDRIPWGSVRAMDVGCMISCGSVWRQRDCSDESSPPVRILRVQLPCSAYGKS